MKIVQFGIPRSGSTLVTQIMKNALKEKVFKVHDYFGGDKIVCTYRDFRDSSISNWRTRINPDKNRKISRQEIYKQFKDTVLHVRSLRRYKEENKAIFLRYEDFVNNYNFIYDELEKYFNIKLDQENRIKLTNYSSFNQNMERSKKFKNFSEWDDTGIHGLHLYKGQVGTWKEFINEDDIDYINDLYFSLLIEWGYIKNSNYSK